jgi:hypothetical protein
VRKATLASYLAGVAKDDITLRVLHVLIQAHSVAGLAQEDA